MAVFSLTRRCGRLCARTLLLLGKGLRVLLVLLARDSVHDAGYFEELGRGELSKNGLQLRLLDQAGQLEVVFGARNEVSVLVARVLDKIPIPDTPIDTVIAARSCHDDSKSDVESCRRQQTRWVLVHFGVQKSKFQQVLGKVEDRGVGLGDLGVALEEAVSRGLNDLELEVKENFLFHIEDLCSRISTVRQKDEVFDRGRVNLLVFCRDQQSRDTYKLDHFLLDRVEGQEAIDEVDCDEEGLREALELGMHRDEPVYQDRPHVLINLSLSAHVKAIWLRFSLRHLHVPLNVGTVDAHVVDVRQGRLVDS